MFRETTIRRIGVTYEDEKNVYQVICGCRQFAFIGEKALMEFIGLYVEDPGKTEREWYRKHNDDNTHMPVSLNNSTPPTTDVRGVNGNL